MPINHLAVAFWTATLLGVASGAFFMWVRKVRKHRAFKCHPDAKWAVNGSLTVWGCFLLLWAFSALGGGAWDGGRFLWVCHPTERDLLANASAWHAYLDEYAERIPVRLLAKCAMECFSEADRARTYYHGGLAAGAGARLRDRAILRATPGSPLPTQEQDRMRRLVELAGAPGAS